jgi:protein-tyrosine-phosphatase
LKIVFVCSANACRSPMAEGFARKVLLESRITGITVDSAGVDAIEGLPATEDTLRAMNARGVNIASHRSKHFLPDARSSDLVLTMTKGQKEKILSEFPFTAGRAFTLNEYAEGSSEDVSDPFKGQASYEEVADRIESSVRLAMDKASGRAKRAHAD